LDDRDAESLDIVNFQQRKFSGEQYRKLNLEGGRHPKTIW
jgi:hypothetical protein